MNHEIQTGQHVIPERLLRLTDIVGRKASPTSPAQPGLLPVSASWVWKAVKEARFPSPVKLGPHTTAWKLSEVLAWIAARTADAEPQAA
jgi:prophage regulatory protein